MSQGVIAGIKLIRHNMGGVDLPDDPSYPFVLDMRLSTGGMFMEVAAAFMYPDGEEVKIRGMTREALLEFVKRNNYRSVSRLRSLTITGPDGAVDLMKKETHVQE